MGELEKFPGVKASQVSRKEGDIELLVGMEMVAAHPTDLTTVGSQRLMKSRFGSGRMLVGVVPGGEGMVMSVEVMHVSRGSWELPVGATLVRQQDKLAHFFELDDMEADPLALCRTCKGCASCTFRASTMSPLELESVQVMEAGMKYDAEKN